MKREKRALLVLGPLLALLLWMILSLPSSPEAAIPQHPVFPVGIVDGSVVLTLDQGSITSRTPSNCTTPRSSCRAEHLGRFALRCPCRSVFDEPLWVDGHPVPLDPSPRVIGPPATATVIGICSVIRGDDAFLSEWISFHRMLGVNLFFLYSDEPVISKRAATARLLLTLGPNIVFEERRFAGDALERQFVALNHCVRSIPAEWVAVLDVDEFFFACAI